MVGNTFDLQCFIRKGNWRMYTANGYGGGCGRCGFFKKEATGRCLPVASVFAVLSGWCYPNMLSRIPAATAEPMTPATFGPMACMRRKLLGLAS